MTEAGQNTNKNPVPCPGAVRAIIIAKYKECDRKMKEATRIADQMYYNAQKNVLRDILEDLDAEEEWTCPV